MRVAIVGAGWAGIAAAVELTAAGARATLIEAGRTLGGRARSISLAGRQLDNGQHVLLGAYRETLALMRRVGADPTQLLLRRPLLVSDNSGFRLALPHLPAPANLAWALLAARGIGLREKLKTAYWMAGVKRRHFRLPEDSSVATWLDANGQTDHLRRHLWEPLCLAALNTPAERASAQVFANVLRDSLGSPRRADTDLLLPRVALGEVLPQPAAAWLTQHGAEIRLASRVTQVQADPEGIAIDGRKFDYAILATAPQHLGKLFPGLNSDYDYEPIATVYLQYGVNTRLPYPLISHSGALGQWTVDRGNGLLACILSGHGAWENFSDAELAASLNNELAIGEPPSWHKVVRERRATISCRPGLVRVACKTEFPRLLIAGDHTWSDYPATLEGAVRSGLTAARRILDNAAG